MICKKCNKYELTYRSECKVCEFKKRRKQDIENVLNKNFWNIEELEQIIYSLLYEKVSCVNEILPFLNNKTLDDLVLLLSKDMTIRGITPSKVKVKCEVCNKDYLINLSQYFLKEGCHRYCCFECRNKGFEKFGTHKGERNSTYNSKPILCTNCGKEYLAPKYVQKQTNSYGENNHFCCQKCYWEYRSKHYVKEMNINYGTKLPKERLLQMSEITTKRICNGDFPQTQTKPHLKTNKILDKLNITYTNEYNCKYHSLDIFLDEYNLGIEVMGDYWHGSPIKYKKEKLSNIQLKGIKQDKSKHTYIKKYRGFEILYLWEDDIKNNTKVCEELIKFYIKNKGIIKDYNSFNYYVNDNEELCIKENIIYPYFIKQDP